MTRTRKLVTALGIVSAVLFAGLFIVLAMPRSAPVNPLCTTTAQIQLNNYWQGQIANATPATMNGTLSAALTATAARAKLCGEDKG